MTFKFDNPTLRKFKFAPEARESARIMRHRLRALPNDAWLGSEIVRHGAGSNAVKASGPF